MTSIASASRPAAPGSAWTPLRQPVFRMLWIAWLTANLCMWMNDVTAAWLMTSLSGEPLMVALVQAAATLPVFLLGAPSGALADILDRRRYFIATQLWAAAVAVVLCAVALSGLLSPALLLVLTFANGIGLAMRWPVFAALVPELVPRAELGKALALNGVAMNASRVIGPVIAGAIIASVGGAWVFLLNALLSIGVTLTLLSWQRKRKVSALPAERFFSALRGGFQYARQSPELRGLLLRGFSFFLFAVATLALLPVVAKQLPDGNAGTYSLLLATMGGGAILSVILLPRVRERFGRDQVALYSTAVNALATLALALAPNLWLSLPALLLVGMSWLATANSITVSVQLALPDWVRARGMSIYQMAMMGGSALGAALWGQVASLSDTRTSLGIAAIAALLGLLWVRRIPLESDAGPDLTPEPFWDIPETAMPVAPQQGPVMVQIEYRIDPSRAEAFKTLMQESRRSRLRNGAPSWELFQDVGEPGRFIEYFVHGSWVEHMRQHERVTTHDRALWERTRTFHLGEEPPLVFHYIAEREPHRTWR
jgi:MFS family permease